MDVLHGRSIPDPYRCLEDPTSAGTQRWSSEQDELFEGEVATWPGRDWLRKRLRALLSYEVVSPPVCRGHRQFFMRRRPNDEHAVLIVSEGLRERTLFDPMAIDPSGLTTLDAWQPSQEGQRVAVQTSRAGTEEAVLTVLEVDNGGLADGPIDRLRYSSIGWLPGGDAFFYVRAIPPCRGAAEHGRPQFRGVFLHRVSSDPADDILVFPADQREPTRPGLIVSADGRWLLLSVSYGTGRRNDLWIANLASMGPEKPAFTAVQVGEDFVTAAHIRDGRMFVLTNRDAPRNRLCVTTPDRPEPAEWQELVAEAPDANLEEFVVIDDPVEGANQLLLGWTRHALTEITVHDARTGEQLGTIDLPGEGTAHHLVAPPQGGAKAWFEYTDVLTPPWVWCYDAATRTAKPWRPRPVPDKAPEVYITRAIYRAGDGTLVRLTLIGPAPNPDCPRPTILHAYGGFGEQRRPGYTASVLAWVEAGGVYAVAHVRGGGEEGAEWHHAGILGNKQKTLDDFAAAARWLVATGWTTAEQLCFSGGSNGGLVVMAVVVQQPELCNAVMAATPLLDMVRYEHHGLGRLWTREYGTTEDPEQLSWLLSYSPYHNVKEGTPYPATLLNIFDNDTRVDPLHARKMCAAMQWATSSTRPILLRREPDVGHSSRNLSRAIALAADALSFAAHWTGLSLPSE